MNGMHDLGGRHGFGHVDIDPDQAKFTAEWERRIFGMFILTFAGGHYNVDQFRNAIEQMDPVHYLDSPYYEHWLHALEELCVASGALTKQELEQRFRQLKAAATA